jgi:hypothetical protein
MKLNLYLCSIVLLFKSFSAIAQDTNSSDWGPVTNGVQMSITVSNNVIQTNTAFQLRVRVRNLSKTNLAAYWGLAPSTDVFSGVHCEITSPSGKDVSPNRVSYGGSGMFLSFPPHQTSEFNFKLSDVCRFDEVGTYSIVASKGIWLEKNKGWVVVSNPLLITVVATNTVAASPH